MVIVKKIVDAGGLRSPSLEDYLSQSRGHFAVMTEFVTMEMFGGNAAINVRESLAIISRFPSQVILLKGNAKISKLTGRPGGLQKRLQDERKTQAFVRYCRALFHNTVPAGTIARDIADKGDAARQWMDRILQKTASVRSGLENLEKRIDAEDLKAIRRGHVASPAFTNQVVADIMGLTALHFRDVACLHRMPSDEEALFTFPFRYAVCAYTLSLKWVIDRGYANAKSTTLKNDYIDMTYAAYATFFDGLITKDKKLQELYALACWVLDKVFGLKPLT